MSPAQQDAPGDARVETERARHGRLRAAFVGAIDLPPEERASFLARECGGDASLVAEAEELLADADRQVSVGDDVRGALWREAAGLFGAAESSTPPPRLVGPYRVEREIGRGGMGVVYLARDERLGRSVALKSLPVGASGPAARARLEQEARVLASLTHPHIAAIHAIEEVDGRPFLVLELVPGESLEERLARGPLALAETLRLMAQVAQALAAAHRRGIVHRDLKPANVRVTPEGEVKVLDFGLAKLLPVEDRATGAGIEMLPRTGEGPLIGTPAYMSPEQLTRGVVSRAADVWAFGCLLYECLSGKRPWPGTTTAERIEAILAREPDLSGLSAETPGEIVALIGRCLEKEPRARPQAADLCLEVASGPSAPRLPRRHSLPAEQDAFVGRDVELAELERLLDGGARLVTLVGAAGIGKTRLARRLGSRLLARYPGGVWFCDLTEARNRAGIASAVATVLEVALGPGDSVVQLGHAIAGRGKALLILDNFEQVVGEAAATVGHWVGRATDAVFVATSRERLRIPGEEVLTLGPLPVDGAGLALFVERARAQRQGFALDDGNRDAVREAVRLLDGLPLAIELAAARILVLSPAQIVERLHDRFALLASARGAGRQTTLRAAIDWSWELLEPWEKAALAQASVFEGGFTLEAAEAVLDLGAAPPVLDVVESLIDKSLLRTLAVVSDRPRFGMFVSFQEYAAEKLRAPGTMPPGACGGEARPLAEERHGRYYAGFGTDDAIEALDRAGGVDRRRRLELELDNLAVACRRAVARRDGETAASALLAAWAVLELRGPVQVAVELAGEVLAMPDLGRDRRAAAFALAGRAYWNWGRMAEARRHFGQALAIHREMGNRREEGIVLGFLGTLHRGQGRNVEARRDLEEALTIHRQTGNRRFEGALLCNLGLLQQEHGKMEEARRCFEEALAIDRGIGNRRFEASVLGNLGLLHHEQGRLEDARRDLDAAIAICREMGDHRGEGLALGNLAGVHQGEGGFEEARRLYEEALAILRNVGHRPFEGIVLGNLGGLNLETGRLEEARPQLEAALAIHREVENRAHEGSILGSMGMLEAREGRFDSARRLLAGGDALLREVGALRDVGVLLCLRAECELLAGDLAAVRMALAEAERLLRAVGDRGELGNLLCIRAEAETRAGDRIRARESLAEATSLAVASGAIPKSILGRNLARARAALGEG